ATRPRPGLGARQRRRHFILSDHRRREATHHPRRARRRQRARDQDRRHPLAQGGPPGAGRDAERGVGPQRCSHREDRRTMTDPFRVFDFEEPGQPDERKKLAATPYTWRDPAKMPRRSWIYGRHYIRKFTSATIAPGGLAKTSLVLVEAIAIAFKRPLLGIMP